jgi:hypothetical protein
VRFVAIRDAGQRVEIDGKCFSACTIVLGIVPQNRSCVTPNALRGLHAAYRPGLLGIKIINEPAIRTLMSYYPDLIRQWIASGGGLGLDIRKLQ